MSTHSIIVLIDAWLISSLADDGELDRGSFDAPFPLEAVGLTEAAIYMAERRHEVEAGEGTAHMVFDALPGDNIRWSASTFGSQEDHSVHLIRGRLVPSDSVGELLIESARGTSYLPPEGSYAPAEAPLDQSIPGPHAMTWAETTVLQSGRWVEFELAFKLIDNTNGRASGYYSWAGQFHIL